jgi:hypothetical protein
MSLSCHLSLSLICRAYSYSYKYGFWLVFVFLRPARCCCWVVWLFRCVLRCAQIANWYIYNLHVRKYSHLFHSYTGWLLSYQLLSQIVTQFASSHFPCLSPIETSLIEQPLNNWSRELLLNNWLLRHSSSSYITLNRTSVTVACCPVPIAATSQMRAV